MTWARRPRIAAVRSTLACVVFTLWAWFPDAQIVTNEPASAISGDTHKVGPTVSDSRPPQSAEEMEYWLRNMFWGHGYSCAEAAAAVGLDVSAVERLRMERLLFPTTRPRRSPGLPPRVLPYPGGRHPRIGFLDGAVSPQRETKFSVFTPWDEDAYVVIDLPEAIWSNLGLTYLAHKHLPTIWDKQGIDLPKLEWTHRGDGLEIRRRLPNDVEFGAQVVPRPDHVAMQFWIRNGTPEALTGLKIQMCAMLKGMPGFSAQSNHNKIFRKPYAACRGSGNRWVIMAWSHCVNAWGNERCPCLHSDPKLPDCAPEGRVQAVGWLSFYEGENIEAELNRIDELGWMETQTTAIRGEALRSDPSSPPAEPGTGRRTARP